MLAAATATLVRNWISTDAFVDGLQPRQLPPTRGEQTYVVQADDLQEIVDSLAERLQRSVAIDDRAIRLIVASRHFGDEDPVRVKSVLGRDVPAHIRSRVLSLGIDRFDGPGRVELPDLGLKPRMCVPIRCNRVLLGYLWLMADERLTSADLSDAAAVADLAGLIMYRRDLAIERRLVGLAALLRDLLSSDEQARRRAEIELHEEGLLRQEASASVMLLKVLEPPQEDPDAQDATESLLARFGNQLQAAYQSSVVTLPRRDRLVVFVATREDRGHVRTPELAKRYTSDLGAMARRRCVAGVGSSVEALRDVRSSYEQAAIAARAAQFVPRLGDVVHWESLGVYALLAKLVPGDIEMAAYPQPFVRLCRSRNASVLVDTAEAFLDHAGDVQAAAEVMHVHRTTLYQRLGRIEALSGLNLRDGGDRLTLHLAIKLARMTGVLDRD